MLSDEIKRSIKNINNKGKVISDIDFSKKETLKSILSKVEKLEQLNKKMIESFKDIKYQLNLSCYDENILSKTSNVWKSIEEFGNIIEKAEKEESK